jgi:hypothetical protein
MMDARIFLSPEEHGGVVTLLYLYLYVIYADEFSSAAMTDGKADSVRMFVDVLGFFLRRLDPNLDDIHLPLMNSIE